MARLEHRDVAHLERRQQVGRYNVHLFYNGGWQLMLVFVNGTSHQRPIVHHYGPDYAAALHRYNDMVERYSVLVAKQALGLES